MVFWPAVGVRPAVGKRPVPVIGSRPALRDYIYFVNGIQSFEQAWRKAIGDKAFIRPSFLLASVSS